MTCALGITGCIEQKGFRCEDSSQCRLGDDLGVCQPSGYCSFTDETCGSGQRYGESSGSGLGGACVTAGNAGVDGGPVDGDSGILELACEEPALLALGGSFSCAAGDDRMVWCWGDNASGQLGIGDFEDRATPMPVDDLGPVTALVAGPENVCAIDEAQDLYCWGSGAGEAYGDHAHYLDTKSPVLVMGSVSSIDTNSSQFSSLTTFCAISDEDVYCFTRYDYGDQLPTVPGDPVDVGGAATAVAVGERHVCVVLEDRTVRCWGDNSFGQLGLGAGSAPVTTPTEVVGLTDVVALDAGANHTCAIKSDASLWCWGNNEGGQLGDASTQSQAAPARVEGIAAASISLGALHTCAVSVGGELYCWGAQGGAIGDGTVSGRAVPVKIALAGGAAVVGAGGAHTCAQARTGDIYCWGSNHQGQLAGGGTLTSAEPIQVPGIDGATQVATGYSHSCALVGDGMKCWGDNANGFLADGTQEPREGAVSAIGLPPVDQIDGTCARADGDIYCWDEAGGTPTRVVPAITDAVDLKVGRFHSCAVTSGGGAACWGSNTSGQLGNGMTADSPTDPVDVTVTSGIPSSMDVGGAHSCAIVGDGVECWGFNGWYQLGDGTTDGAVATAATVNLSGASPAEALASGSYHNCALRQDSSVWCWGQSFKGQLGLEAGNGPGQVAGLQAKAVFASDDNSCALDLMNKAHCWGNNDRGQLGAGTGLNPPGAANDLTFASLSIGQRHICGVGTDGNVYCWGDNSHGQLDGRLSWTHTPRATGFGCHAP